VDFTRDVTIGVDQLSRLSDVVRKIRSTARFLLGNVYRDDDVKSSEVAPSREDFGLVSETIIVEIFPENRVDIRPSVQIEKYMLHLLYEFQHSVQRAYNELDFKQGRRLHSILLKRFLFSRRPNLTFTNFWYPFFNAQSCNS
jgi:isoleucyl-tRNA synthetase